MRLQPLIAVALLTTFTHAYHGPLTSTQLADNLNNVTDLLNNAIAVIEELRNSNPYFPSDKLHVMLPHYVLALWAPNTYPKIQPNIDIPWPIMC